MVEILSPVTAVKDRNSKYQLYLQQKVKYYLIADPVKEEVEIYQLENDAYILSPFQQTFRFNFSDNCSSEIDFSNIWE